MSTIQQLATTFYKRAEATGLRGKKADLAALEFAVGALAMAEMLGDKAATDATSTFAFIVSVRGFSEVTRIAKEAATAEAA